MNPSIIGLVDINNFYVSAERIFQPKLRQKIVVVLSNNDGCVVARSNEAKAAGIKMGMPVFELDQLIKETKIEVIRLSSNYAVYGELSRRFHTIMDLMVSPECTEQYSIDENFFDLTTHKNKDLIVLANEIKQRIKLYLDLPVCVGIGRSKTQAKIANHIAKKVSVFEGVCSIFELEKQGVFNAFLNTIKVEDVWGVGRQYTKRLNAIGIESALDLKNANPEKIGKLFNVVLKKTVLELNGISCFEMENEPEPRQQIVSSKSFGQRINILEDLREAITRFTLDAQIRLRSDELVCGLISVFAYSSPFDKSKPFYKKSLSIGFPQPTDNPLLLVKASTKLIDKIYVKDVDFKKCGLILSCLEPKNQFNYDLFANPDFDEKLEKLTQIVEDIQVKHGRKKIGFGGSMFENRAWTMKQSFKTPNYFDIRTGWVLNEDLSYIFNSRRK